MFLVTSSIIKVKKLETLMSSKQDHDEKFESKVQFSLQKILQNFSHSPSHRIFGRMHEALNINKK